MRHVEFGQRQSIQRACSFAGNLYAAQSSLSGQVEIELLRESRRVWQCSLEGAADARCVSQLEAAIIVEVAEVGCQVEPRIDRSIAGQRVGGVQPEIHRKGLVLEPAARFGAERLVHAAQRRLQVQFGHLVGLAGFVILESERGVLQNS